jgi:WD40 repeat protein
MATAGAEGGMKVWETESGQGVIVFGHTKAEVAPMPSVHKVAFLGPGILLSASGDKTLKRWRFEGTWTASHTLGPHAFRVLALDFHPDGTLLAAGGGEPSRSGEIRIWEVGKGLAVRTLQGLHSDTVFGVRFSPDGLRLASAGADKFMKLTRMSDAGEQTRTLNGAGKQLTAVRWVPGKPMVLGAAGDKVVRFWNPDNGGVARSYSGPGDFVFGVAVSNDGSRVAAGGADGTLFLWNGQDAKVLRKIGPPADAGANPR